MSSFPFLRSNSSFLPVGCMLISLVGLMLGCSDAPKQPEIALPPAEEVLSPVASENNTVDTAVPTAVSADFLITDDAAGRFALGQPWRSVNQRYGYTFTQGYGSCIDACCTGGYLLSEGVGDKKPILTIGAAIFDVASDETRYAKRKDVFYIISDNCSGWYKADEVAYLEIYDAAFQTKEAIGPGSTLSQASKTYPNLIFGAGWIEEDANALYFRVPSYSNLMFILNVEDYLGDWETISMSKEDNQLKVSDFKSGSKVQRVRIGVEK
jgi:hypothetical protein